MEFLGLSVNVQKVLCVETASARLTQSRVSV